MKKLTYAVIFATLMSASAPSFAADRISGDCQNDATTIVNLLEEDRRKEKKLREQPTEYHFPKAWNLQQQYFDCLRAEIRNQTKKRFSVEYDFTFYGESGTEIKYLVRKREII